MKTLTVTLLTTSVIIIGACGASKKSATKAPPATPTSSTPPPTTPMVFAKPTTGMHAPGNEELTAIQAQYKDATLTQLKEGHFLYTESACVKCHEAKNIYYFTEIQWKRIVEDMAEKARISAAEKDAVYKYVLAIKATQPR